jgi:hypothetical protein
LPIAENISFSVKRHYLKIFRPFSYVFCFEIPEKRTGLTEKMYAEQKFNFVRLNDFFCSKFLLLCTTTLKQNAKDVK